VLEVVGLRNGRSSCCVQLQVRQLDAPDGDLSADGSMAGVDLGGLDAAVDPAAGPSSGVLDGEPAGTLPQRGALWKVGAPGSGGHLLVAADGSPARARDAAGHARRSAAQVH
jgi:hypothetical protein